MKKVLAFTLVLVMLASAMVMPSFAAPSGQYGHLVGPSTPGVSAAKYVSQTEYSALVASDTATDYTNEIDGKYYSYKALGENLTESATASNKFIDYKAQGNPYDATLSEQYALKEENLTDLADTKYGISAIGFSHIRRKLTTVCDGKWTNGSYAFEGRWAEKFWDVTGKTATDTVNDATGNVYTCLFTYNFQETKTVDYIVLAHTDNAEYLQNLIHSADIYISNDGENWTLASYWDLAQDKITNGGGTQTNFKNKWRANNAIHTSYLGKDGAGATTANANSFALVLDLGSLQAQYVRIAVNGSIGVGFAGTYTDRSQHMHNLYGTDKSALFAFREMMLIGGDAKETTPTTLTGANYLGHQIAPDGNSFSTRYVATIDSLDYAKAGFDVKIHYFNSAKALTAGNKVTIYAQKAYTEIKQYGMDNLKAKKNGDEYVEWFILFTLEDLSITDQASFIIEVTPFVEDGTGAKTYGDTYRETFIAGVHTASVMIPQ